jgi:hypothetical protein
MSRVLAEYFGKVTSSDIRDCQFGQVSDYLRAPLPDKCFDWVITNPPFRHAEEFVLRSLTAARWGVAIIARTVFLEGRGRYERLYQPHPPSKLLQFTERVPMVKGRLDSEASTATSYAWLIWRTDRLVKHTTCDWIPPCRERLERSGDYDGEQRAALTHDLFGSLRQATLI